MVPGLNSNVERNGAVFHVQSEDLGRSKPILQSLVYYAGEVVTILEYTYEALATSEDYCEDEVRRKLSDQHQRLINEINAGVFDVVDPEVISQESDAAGRQRERILDYLERALTYDTKPCATPEQPDPAPAAVPTMPVEQVVETAVATETDAPATAEQDAEVVAAPVFGPPMVDSRGTPVAGSGASRRLVVIRKDGEEPSEPAEDHATEADETPQIIAVRQADEVQGVAGESDDLEEVLEQLNRKLELTVLAPTRSPKRRWMVVAVPLGALLLGALGWVWFSGTRGTQETSGAVVAVAETPAPRLPAPEPEAPKPEPLPPEPEAESDIRAEVVIPSTPVPPVVDSGGNVEEDPAVGGETAATLVPTIPELPAIVPDPVERLAEQSVQDDPPIEAPKPKPPAAPAPKVRAGMLIELASVDRAPEPTARTFPEYPKRARKKGHQGIVELDLLIDEKGNVADVRVAVGGAESELSDAAIVATRSWKYTPARKGAYKVRVWKPVAIHFSLDDHNQSRVRVEE